MRPLARRRGKPGRTKSNVTLRHTAARFSMPLASIHAPVYNSPRFADGTRWTPRTSKPTRSFGPGATNTSQPVCSGGACFGRRNSAWSRMSAGPSPSIPSSPASLATATHETVGPTRRKAFRRLGVRPSAGRQQRGRQLSGHRPGRLRRRHCGRHRQRVPSRAPVWLGRAARRLAPAIRRPARTHPLGNGSMRRRRFPGPPGPAVWPRCP